MRRLQMPRQIAHRVEANDLAACASVRLDEQALVVDGVWGPLLRPLALRVSVQREMPVGRALWHWTRHADDCG